MSKETENKTLLNDWTKLCLRNKTTPICLITVSDDGTPHVFTHHSSSTLKKVYAHLLQSGEISETKHPYGQEN